MARLRVSGLLALAVLASGCAPVVPAPAPVARPAWLPLTQQGLLGTWELTHVNAQPVPRNISLSFGPDGNVEGLLTCGNRLLGAYK